MLTFPLLLLEFVDVVHSLASSPHIYIFRSDAWLFEELYIADFLIPNQNRLFEVEVDHHDNFLRWTWLEEAMLNIGETNVDFLPFGCDETTSIRVNFQVTECFFAKQVRSDNQTLENISPLVSW